MGAYGEAIELAASLEQRLAAAVMALSEMLGYTGTTEELDAEADAAQTYVALKSK